MTARTATREVHSSSSWFLSFIWAHFSGVGLCCVLIPSLVLIGMAGTLPLCLQLEFLARNPKCQGCAEAAMVFLQPHKRIPSILQNLISKVTFVLPAPGKLWPQAPVLPWRGSSSEPQMRQGLEQQTSPNQEGQAPPAMAFQSQIKVIYCLHLLQAQKLLECWRSSQAGGCTG